MRSFLISSRTCLTNMIEGVKTLVAGKTSAEHTTHERTRFSADTTETNNIVHVYSSFICISFFRRIGSERLVTTSGIFSRSASFIAKGSTSAGL